jgi:hypothetical protein
VNGNAAEMLQRGSALIAPLLETHGFVFNELGVGNSSGGSYASGKFQKDNRWLELHFRFSLGLISYHLGNCSMSHQDYMHSVIGKPNSGHYPGFSNDPLDGFRHLLVDLQEYGSEFLAESDECLIRRIEMANNLPRGGFRLPD